MTKVAVPPPPQGFDPDKLFRGVTWYQKWEVFSGIFTPGLNPIREICDLINLPADLSGRRVLDVGSSNGCMSLECERRGAAEVIGLTPVNGPEWGHWQLLDAVGSTRTHFKQGTVYDLDPDVLGYFDTVLFCGVLYHLRYPTLAIDNLRRIATGDVFIETHVLDPALDGIDKNIPVWRFYRLNELNNDYSNWFDPNVAAVLAAFGSAGFEIALLNSDGKRARFNAVVKAGTPEFLTTDCMEADRYEVSIRHLFGSKEAWDRPIGLVEPLRKRD